MLQVLLELAVLVELLHCFVGASNPTILRKCVCIPYRFISLYVKYIHVCKIMVMLFNLAFTHWVCMIHHSFYSLFQILLESVLHPFLLLRPCYLSVDAMTLMMRWAGITMEILLYSHWWVSYVYILIVLVRETEFCKWFIYLDSLCWDVYIWVQFCWFCCGTSWLLMPSQDVMLYT